MLLAGVPAPFSGTSRFRVTRHIGSGGFGVVYEVEDVEGRSRLALKTLARFDAASLYRFKKEFRVFADIRHPNLVRVHELVSEGPYWFFTMDLVVGVDWLAYVRGGATTASTAYDDTMDASDEHAAAVHPRARAGTADPERLRFTLSQLVHGLSALHDARVIHCDIKPANVLVTPEGHVVVLDFGLATMAVGADVSTSDVHTVFGTPAYMAPEQAAGIGLSPAIDWYALGTMLFEALTGTLPFTGAPMQLLMEKQARVPPRPSTLVQDVPADLDDLCADLLDVHPEKRPGAADILRRLGDSSSAPVVRALPRSSTSAPFVGRADVLRRLGEAYAVSRAGTLALALVHGTSGMGKSAAVKAFVERAEGRPVVLQGRCFQRESVPYKAFDPVVDSLTHYLLTLSREEVAGLMPREVSALARIFPVLERVPAVAEAPRKWSDATDLQLLRRRAFAALRELLTRLADRHPVIVVLDDVQWGDADSAGLLGELTSPPEAPPLLLILAYRSEEAADSPLLAAFNRRAQVVGFEGVRCEVTIEPLSGAEALELAQRLLENVPDAAALAATLAQECLGSPFFLGELAQYAKTEVGNAERKPIRLEDLISLRVSQLTDEGRLVLRLASLSGGNVGRAVAMRASYLDESRFAATLDALRIGNMIKLAGLKGELVEPFHDRIREAVFSEMNPGDKRALHRALAQAIIVDPSPDPEILLLHYVAAGMPDEARGQATKAASRAESALAFDRAAALWDEALAIDGWEDGTRRTMQLARAEALVRAGRGGAAADAFLALVAGADPIMKIDLMRRAGEQLVVVGEHARGMSVLRDVMASVGEKMPPSTGMMLVRVLLMRGWRAMRGWSFTPRDPTTIPRMDIIRMDVVKALGRACVHVEPAYTGYYFLRLGSLALSAGYANGVLSALTGAIAVFYLGLFVPSGRKSKTGDQPLVRMASRLAASLDDPQMSAHFVQCSGAWLTVSGQYAEGAPFLERTLTELRESGAVSQWDLNTAVFFWALNHGRAGGYAALGARLPIYLRDGFDRGDLWLTTNLRMGASAIHWLVEDKPAEGRRDIEEALRSWRHEDFDMQQYYAGYALGILDIYEGRPGEALVYLTSLSRKVAWSAIRFVPVVQSEVSTMAFRAAVAHLAEAPESPERMRVARIWRKRAYRAVTWFHLPTLHLMDAGLSFVCGDREGAKALATRALQGALAGSLAQYVAFSRYRLAQLDDGSDGKANMAASLAWMTGQGVRRPDRFLQAHSPGFDGPSKDDSGEPQH